MLLLNRFRVSYISSNNHNTFKTRFSSYLLAYAPAKIVRVPSLGTGVATLCTEVASVHAHGQLDTD